MGLLGQERWEAAKAALGARRDRLNRLAAMVHANPEEGGKEFRAAAWLAEHLSGEGFAVQRPVGGLPTAFRAHWSGGRAGPVVAYPAEYDALPGLGHACGHNLIAASAVGAGAVLRQVMNAAGLQGTVVVLGTPAEETGGGKLRLLEAGAFAGVDAAFMMHPGTVNRVGGASLALTPVRFTFRGRAAHAAASPHAGVNALDAVIQTFYGVNALRQHLTNDVDIHGIITRGGVAPNIVPEVAEAYFHVQAATAAAARATLRRLESCARAGALATGSSLEVQEEPGYRELAPNSPLERCLEALLIRAGVELETMPATRPRASTGFGNVSHALPAVLFTLAIAPREVAVHSPGFAAAAASPRAEQALGQAVLVLAAAGLCLLEDPSLPAAAHDYRMGRPLPE